MTDSRAADFQPEQVIRLLHRHNVRYVLIGGLAASIHGSPSVTKDVDVCYARDEANLNFLTDALREVNATLRGAPADLPFRLEAQTLRNGDTFTFLTDIGAIDILGTPAGTGGFDDLANAADEVEAFGVELLVAAIEDLIRMKRAAGRAKDRIELEILGALREEIERKGATPR